MQQEGPVQPPEDDQNAPNRKDGDKSVEQKKSQEAENRKKSEEKQKTDKDKREVEKRQKEFEKKVKAKEDALKKAKAAGKEKVVEFAEVRESVEIVDAIQDEKGVIANPEDVIEFHRILTEYGGFSETEYAALGAAEQVAAVQTVLRNIKIKDPTRYDLGYGPGEEDGNPAEYHSRMQHAKAVIKKVQSYSEETLTPDKVYDYLDFDPEGGRPTRAGVGATIAGIPTAASITNNPILRTFVEEIEGATVARGEENMLERLSQVEAELRRAIVEGRFNAPGTNTITDARVETVRTLLRGFLDAEYAAYQTRATSRRGAEMEESRKEQGYIDFNEHFGDDYQQTKGFIEANNGAEVKRVMQEVKDVIDSVLATRITDYSDETQWPTIGEENIRKVFEVARAVKQGADRLGRQEFGRMAGMDDPARDLLDLFISKDRDKNIIDLYNRFYQNLYQNLNKARQRVIAGDVEENARLATDTISAGWQPFNNRMKQLFDAVYERRVPGRAEDLRLWRGYFLISGVEGQVVFAQLTKPPAHWEDTPGAVFDLLSRVEGSRMPVSDMQQYAQAALGMLTRVERDTEFGRAMYDELTHQIEAFRFKHALVITAQKKDMNPGALKEVFDAEMEGTAEVTFSAMITRFARDTKGREFYAGKRNPDGTYNRAEMVKTNVFDVGKRQYSNRLREDRIKMNIAEELSKYSITNIDAATMNKIRKAVGFEYLPNEWKAKWNDYFNETRNYLIARWQYLAGPDGLPQYRGMNISQWASESDLAPERLKKFQSLTKDVIRDWYEHKTLHGAFGEIKHADLAEIFADAGLKDAFEIPGETPAEYQARVEKIIKENGGTWFGLRRAEMRWRLKKELERAGLSFDTNVHYGDHGDPANIKRANVDDLFDSGFISTVETNVYDLTWIFEWSTLEMIHIYGKKPSKYKDDYKALVHTRSTEGYYAKLVDHNWEYMHADFEDRGRARQNEFNQIMMQYFPGKHHWVFGHVSMATRFIRGFINDAQRAAIDKRTAELIKEYDFHTNTQYKPEYYDFIESVAIREMIINGVISFADRDYSQVVSTRTSFNKFNPIDNADDRERLLKFIGAGALQSYLANPEAEKFIKLTTKEELFPSTRDPRLFPWMHFGLRAHWEMVHNHKHRLMNEPDITNQEMENMVDNLVGGGFLLKEEGEKFKRKRLGVLGGHGPLTGRALGRKLRWFFHDEAKKERQVEGRFFPLFLLLMTLIWSSFKGLTKGSMEEAKKQ